MSTHQHEERSAETRAALYVAGAMSAAEIEQFEADIAAGDSELASALAAIGDVGDALGQMIESVEPSAALRERINAISEHEQHPNFKPVWRSWDSGKENQRLFTLRAGEGEWEETGIDGIQVRRLYVDEENDRMTAMFRMAPGTSYVSHVHDQPEECFVLEGDLHVGDEIHMHAGDYQRAPAGSLHGRQWTENGCLLLVTCSLHDEAA